MMNANGLNIEESVSLRSYNTFGIDATARRMVHLPSDDDFVFLLESGILCNAPFFVLGGGSNVVFSGNYEGTVVHPENSYVRLLGKEGDDVLVQAGAGTVWAEFVDYCIAHGWHGLENLSSIPGTVGAAPVQNVGAYGVEVADVVESVCCLDLHTADELHLSASDCSFGYRNSVFKNEPKNRCLVKNVTFRLHSTFAPKTDYKALSSFFEQSGIVNPTPVQFAQAVSAVRSSKLPEVGVIGSAGSFFKNPIVSAEVYCGIQQKYPDVVAFPAGEGLYKLAAGWLIEKAGWKGRRIGNVGVYDKQALVLVNYGGGTGRDVLSLAQAVMDDVYDKFGVSLSPEAIIV